MPDTLADIDRLIASTWASLSGARAAAWHSPNAGSLRNEEILGERVDFLLDRRVRRMAPEDLAAALTRPTRRSEVLAS